MTHKNKRSFFPFTLGECHSTECNPIFTEIISILKNDCHAMISDWKCTISTQFEPVARGGRGETFTF